MLDNTIIRSLMIPVDTAPYVLEDTLDGLKRFSFYNLPTHTISFSDDYSIIVSHFYDKSYRYSNFFATTLLRSLHIDLQQNNYVLYGPAMFVGTDYHGRHGSIPMKILDPMLNLMSRYSDENTQELSRF